MRAPGSDTPPTLPWYGEDMELVGKFLVVWLSAEAVETVFGIPSSERETPLTSWLVGGTVVAEAGPGLWLRVDRLVLPDGQQTRVADDPIHFVRWDLVTTARLFLEPPAAMPSGLSFGEEIRAA